jgi:thiamine-phosphate pyrophosphorylase
LNPFHSKIDFRLIVITDFSLYIGDPVSLVAKISSNGVKAIQLREKTLPAVRLLDLAVKIKSRISKNTSLIINDRLDIAILSGAQGLHSPESGVLTDQIKKYSRGFILGKSVHSLKGAMKAEKDGYNYLIFGPVFRTPAKKKYGKPQGLRSLARVCQSVNIPVFAVGGITPYRIKKCLDSGAHGVAAIRQFMTSQNIKQTVKDYKRELGSL